MRTLATLYSYSRLFVSLPKHHQKRLSGTNASFNSYELPWENWCVVSADFSWNFYKGYTDTVGTHWKSIIVKDSWIKPTFLSNLYNTFSVQLRIERSLLIAYQRLSKTSLQHLLGYGCGWTWIKGERIKVLSKWMRFMNDKGVLSNTFFNLYRLCLEPWRKKKFSCSFLALNYFFPLESSCLNFVWWSSNICMITHCTSLS